MRTIPITVRLPEKVLKRVQECAENKNATQADWVRYAIVNALQQADEAQRFQQLEARFVQRMGELETRLIRELQGMVAE